MIKNLPRNRRLEKMRVIHLFEEVDYNLILKVTWVRRTIWNAYNRNALNPGQTGRKPGGQAIDVELIYSKLSHTLFATVDNELKSCFDQILRSVAMLISRHFGVPENLCKLQSATLKNTTFNIRIALGDSKRTYQRTNTTPIHSTGQGSSSSPEIWLLISSFLM
jgi:hypothetical protein